MLGTIYALAEPETNRVRYCGKTARHPDKRTRAHRNDAYRYRHRHVCNWLRSIYDRGEDPRFIICEQLDLSGLPRVEQMERLNAAERRWIEQFKVLGFSLTNATKGGDGCHGRVVSKETRDRQRASNTGKKRSPETCALLSQIARTRNPSVHLRGENHQHFGKPQAWRNPEKRTAKIRSYWQQPHVRAEQSLRMKGTMSAEELAKQSARHKGNKHAARMSEETAREILLAAGSHRKIAQMFGVSRQLVGMIKNGQRWPHLSH